MLLSVVSTETSGPDADIQCSNGIIHVIDSVLLPPNPKPKKLLEVAAESGTFTKLVAGIEAAGLSSVIDGEGPFTVFAPTDEAVDKLPEDSESLLLDENRDKLEAILKYLGRCSSAYLSAATTRTPMA
jgi:transforming growth factor-beta-induced protein